MSKAKLDAINRAEELLRQSARALSIAEKEALQSQEDQQEIGSRLGERLDSLKLNEVDAQALFDDMREALLRVCQKHDVSLDIVTRLTQARGVASLTAKMQSNEYLKEAAKNPERKRSGETQAQLRFRLSYIAAGLNLEDLNAVFLIGRTRYELLGLKGRRNKVILQALNGRNTGQEKIMECQDFVRAIGRAS